MRKFLLISIFFVFALTCPLSAQADAWRAQEAPHDEEMQTLLVEWIRANKSDFCGEFEKDEELLLERLVEGTLIWAQKHGNSFDAQAFLALFDQRSDAIRWCVFPTGAMLFVLENTYLRIAMDPTVPESLPSDLQANIRGEGRWYVAFGSGNRTTLFYFANAAQKDGLVLTP